MEFNIFIALLFIQRLCYIFNESVVSIKDESENKSKTTPERRYNYVSCASAVLGLTRKKAS